MLFVLSTYTNMLYQILTKVDFRRAGVLLILDLSTKHNILKRKVSDSRPSFAKESENLFKVYQLSVFWSTELRRQSRDTIPTVFGISEPIKHKFGQTFLRDNDSRGNHFP